MQSNACGQQADFKRPCRCFGPVEGVISTCGDDLLDLTRRHEKIGGECIGRCFLFDLFFEAAHSAGAICEVCNFVEESEDLAVV